MALWDEKEEREGLMDRPEAFHARNKLLLGDASRLLRAAKLPEEDQQPNLYSMRRAGAENIYI
jgi:hypothetical protein